jgi:two-component system NtrC family sensor kinase
MPKEVDQGNSEARSHESGNGKHASYYAGIRFRIAVLFVLVSVSPMLLVVFIILYQFHTFSNEMVYAHVEQLVQKHQQNIDYFNLQKLNDIRHLSRSFEVAQFKDDEFLKERLRILQDEYGLVFVDIGLIDARGVQVSYAGPFDLQKADYGKAPWFQQARTKDDYISDVFLGLRGYPHFIVAVKMQEGGAEWLLRATIDFGAFNTLVDDLRVGKTGTAFILNRDGEFQTRPPPGKPTLTKQQYLNLFKKGDQALPTVPQDASKANGHSDGGSSVFTAEKVSDDGGKYIVAAAFLKSNEWLLVFQQEHADAFAKQKRSQIIAGLISLLGALSTGLMAFVVSGRLVKHIAKLDFEKAVMNRQVIESGKLASVGELAAGIAHEINNPVAIMVEEAGWCEDLMDEGLTQCDPVELRRALHQIRTQGRRCKEITHKLLSFARKTDSRIEAVQLNELIREVVDLLAQKSRYANVEIEVDLQPDLPVVQASITEMQQVLMNILHNAVDAMAKTGGKIVVSSTSVEGAVRLSIADTGPGIPAVDLERIFDPFFTTKPVGKGTGLGLSICYGIVKKMGGDIEVESQVDKGATFRIVLPLGQTPSDTEGK